MPVPPDLPRQSVVISPLITSVTMRWLLPLPSLFAKLVLWHCLMLLAIADAAV